ncbi:hypothetical protein [Duganella qianjiadongensis]|uniref:Uncharacterized protein n=1 Tax=Duganella qianjiadongensis TaxID=2692176 RepID=A0ABW9VJE0_9BURK|nr:hypothetical protein [Duganella qianjiadongensis]MYM38648.1 hypothetical protein [Duganella qianjiadongensis]
MTLDKRSCMARAQALMAEAKIENLKYAALELRLCIESQTYEKLRAFSSMVPEDVLRTWQPPQAVKMLLEFEPHADQTFTIYAGLEEEYGKPAKEMSFVGTHSSLRLGWLRKHYNKLGSLLHAPAVYEPRLHNLATLKQYLEEVIEDLKEPLESTITGGAIRNVVNFTCSECGKPVIANAETLRKKRKAICLNPQCKAEYYANIDETGQVTLQLMATGFECASESCDGVAQIENRKLEVGIEFSCPKCGLRHQIAHREWGYGPIEK